MKLNDTGVTCCSSFILCNKSHYRPPVLSPLICHPELLPHYVCPRRAWYPPGHRHIVIKRLVNYLPRVDPLSNQISELTTSSHTGGWLDLATPASYMSTSLLALLHHPCFSSLLSFVCCFCLFYFEILKSSLPALVSFPSVAPVSCPSSVLRMRWMFPLGRLPSSTTTPTTKSKMAAPSINNDRLNFRIINNWATRSQWPPPVLDLYTKFVDWGLITVYSEFFIFVWFFNMSVLISFCLLLQYLPFPLQYKNSSVFNDLDGIWV